jgi:hypothetical protein
VIGAAWLAGCAGGETATRPTVSGPGPRPGLDGGAVPDEQQIARWVEQIVEQGVRRPGYPADEWATAFCEEQLSTFGLADVHREPVDVTRWEPHRWSLHATPAGSAPRQLDCFPLPYSAPTTGLEVELVAFDADRPGAAAGSAALVDAAVLRVPATGAAVGGSAPTDLTGRIYDPDGTLADEEHVLPHTIHRNRILEPVVEGGAAAFVGTLVDYPVDSCGYFVPYDGEPAPIPGVWINASDGRWLRDQLDQGSVRIRIEIDATAEPVQSDTVVGELSGADDELVIIGSHHDGPWASAVEDASGVALVLAQASYWAAQPVDQRPHRLRFVLHAGHMCGAAGLVTYLDQHRDELDRIVLEVHLEHAALDAERHDDELVVPGRCVPRWFFTSRIPELEAAVSGAIAAEDLRRSMLVAPDALGARPPTDGGRYHDEGVPVVQLLAAPWYLFDEVDTIDKLDRANLVPITRTVIRIVESTRGRTAADLR